MGKCIDCDHNYRRYGHQWQCSFVNEKGCPNFKIRKLEESKMSIFLKVAKEAGFAHDTETGFYEEAFLKIDGITLHDNLPAEDLEKVKNDIGKLVKIKPAYLELITEQEYIEKAWVEDEEEEDNLGLYNEDYDNSYDNDYEDFGSEDY